MRKGTLLALLAILAAAVCSAPEPVERCHWVITDCPMEANGDGG